ncbi:N-acetyltransferase family protein [Dermacoccaceae bacterium W4C1]
MSDSDPANTGGSVVIRRADGDDLQAVVHIGRTVWPLTYGPIAGEDYVAMGLAKWWTADANIPAIRAGRVTVAEVDGEVVGMSSVGTDDGRLRLWKLYVLPQHQGRRLGTVLLQDAVDKAATDGHDTMWLSYVRGNDRAAAFYARHGFVEVETESGGSGVPDSIVARRGLTDVVPGQPPTEEQDVTR